MRRLDAYLRNDVPCGRTRSGVVLCDSYARGSALGSTDNLPFLPGIPGKAYTAVAGTWATTGNVLTPTGSSPGGNGWYVTCDPGVLLHSWEFVVAQLSGSSSGPVVRWVDANNHYQLTLGSAQCQFYEFNASVATARGTATTGVTLATGDSIFLTVNGSSLSAQVMRAGVPVGTAATYSSASLHTSATAIGYRSTSTSSKYGNMSVRRAA